MWDTSPSIFLSFNVVKYLSARKNVYAILRVFVQKRKTDMLGKGSSKVTVDSRIAVHN
ncbi:hypothetical protein J32TS6_35620 [Virgibacillus pantothenticus]|nr:hypothetical protein J32TS6_35620 [Virgibacillus pantothenticus]